MNKLNLEFVNLESDYIVEVDDKICDFKKIRKKRNLTYEYQTENDKVNISIKRLVPQSAKNWWLWQIIFFFVSLFGIFDFVENKKCLKVDFDATIDLSEETNVKIIIQKNTKEKLAVKLLTEANVVEHKNEMSVDMVAKKRLKAIKVLKIIFWIALVIGSAVLIISKIMD